MVFGKDPLPYLDKIGVGFLDAIDGETPAVLSEETLLRVNHELYLFAGLETMGTFEIEPWRWCGRVTDPITLDRFVPARSSPAVSYDGQRFYFASDSTLAAFAENPAMYASPRNRMAPPDSSASDVTR